MFLNHVRDGQIALTVFLVNGIRLQGILTWFDSFSPLLRRDSHSQLVYKQALSTIVPADPVRLYEQDDASEPIARATVRQIRPSAKMPADGPR